MSGHIERKIERKNPAFAREPGRFGRFWETFAYKSFFGVGYAANALQSASNILREQRFKRALRNDLRKTEARFQRFTNEHHLHDMGKQYNHLNAATPLGSKTIEAITSFEVMLNNPAMKKNLEQALNESGIKKGLSLQ